MSTRPKRPRRTEPIEWSLQFAFHIVVGREEWCVVTPVLGGLDNRKEIGEEGLIKVVMPLHGAGIWLAHL